MKLACLVASLALLFGLVSSARAEDVLKEYALEMAKQIVEYERVVVPALDDGGVYRTSEELIVLDKNRQEALAKKMSAGLSSVDSYAWQEAKYYPYAAKSRLRMHLMTSQARRSAKYAGIFVLGGLGIITAGISGGGLLLYAAIGIPVTFKSIIDQSGPRADKKVIAQFQIDEEVRYRRKFYEILRKELKRLGTRTQLPAWGSIAEAHLLTCEQLFLKNTQIKLLSAPLQFETE